MFTADPLSGSASSIVINANYGLGESVVSGRADPDTITVYRHPEFVYDLTALRTGSVTPGQKKLKIVHSGGLLMLMLFLSFLYFFIDTFVNISVSN